MQYHIELRGLSDAPGTIDIVALRDVLNALIDAAGRSLRLVVEGRSTRRGTLPAWITNSVRFRLTDLQEGSTVLPVDVPRLGDTASEVINQTELWRDLPKPEETVLAVLGRSIADIGRADREGGRYDRGVLEAVGSFGRILRNGESIHLRKVSEDAVSYEITRTHVAHAKTLKDETPDPRAVVVPGTINVIKHAPLSFELQSRDGRTIPGHAENITGEKERLRELWSKKVTVEGMGQFTPSGNLRFIEARVVRAFQPRDAFFEHTFKKVESRAAREVATGAEEARRFDAGSGIEKIRGMWPGDESIEELLEALD